jgi:hypothetical protein
MYVNYSGFERDGVIFPVYRLRSLDIEGQKVRTSLSNVTLKVLPLSSLLERAPTCYVEFGAGTTSISFMGNVLDDILSHDGGRLWMTASGKRLKVSGTHIRGDLQISGELDYDRSSGALTNNTILIRAPENMDAMMNNPPASQIVEKYIEPVNPGEWRLKQNAISN